ncbi:MAG: transcription-repair coupling factor [Phycisphaeraceae bacterium]
MRDFPHGWLDRIVHSAALDALCARVGASLRTVAEGSWGSSTTLVAGALAVRLDRPVLLVVAHLDDADDAYEDLALFEAAGHALGRERFGAMEVLPGESNVSLELLAERLAVVEKLVQFSPASRPSSKTRMAGLEVNPKSDGFNSGAAAPIRNPKSASVLVAPIQALMQTVPEASALGDFSLVLEVGKALPPGQLLDWLDRAGYQRADAIEQPGDFTTRGGIVDIYLPSAGGADVAGPAPIRIDYFGDDIDSLSLIDTDTMGSGRKLQRVQVIGASTGRLQSDDRTTSLLRLLPADTLVVLHEVLELSEQARGYYERLTQVKGIISPKALLKALTERRHVEVNQYGSTAAKAEVIRVPVSSLFSFSHDAGEAVGELAELAHPPLPPGSEGEGGRGSARPGEGTTGLRGANVDTTASGDGPSSSIEPTLVPDVPSPQPSPSGGSEGRGGQPPSPQPSPQERAGTVVVLCEQDAERERLRELITEHVPAAPPGLTLESGYLHRGFAWDDGGLLHLVPHHELFHRYLTRRRIRRIIVASDRATDAFFDLVAGDYVVHVDHGIARFVGLKTMRGGQGKKITQDYLTLEFAQKALLHVPATQIDLVQKYIGGFEGRPPLSLLGGKRWARQKEQVEEAVKDLAKQMLQIQAARASLPGIRFPADTAWQREFEAEFPYEETEDQLAAIAETKKDMGDEQPMDRLICGDVGFGKTEVAIRAAFKAIEFGKQVAVLVPTTVLAEQHERTFRGRMADYPFRVESVSRFKTGGQQAKLLKDLAAGQIDVIIGTHRLLSNDVKFADLGLVVVDEEQRFGVEHKHKLLEFRLTADVLTLTATPIPRTLHMAMLGLRDISSLSIPPADRRAIVTEVVRFDRELVRRALMRELNREGQVYFVHNRVHNIQSVADDIRKLAPDARIVVGHGQMPGHELEEVMLRFMRREADILVSTTIIESGIDIPTANTMFINEADHYGLADLHQLRGRVGRYKHRAYCYLLMPEDRPITDKAAKRLKAIEQFSMLGAGFKIAMRDLEIRGAGNLLGAEQSGHIAAVGYEMYCRMLEQEARKLRHEKVVEPVKTHLELPVLGRIPPTYISSEKYRMDAYRRMSRSATLEELAGVRQDMVEAYGKPPTQVEALLDLTEIRIAASTLDVAGIKLEGPDLIFRTTHPQRLDEILRDAPGRASLIDDRTVYWRPPANYLEPMETLLAVLRKLLVRPVATTSA